jgi:tricarballylate dehydrogenase
MAKLGDLQADVIVLGGGNAALCAAISARHEGARVLLLERAPHHLRGGNSRHTRNVRYAHQQRNDFVTGGYPEDEFMDDLLRVTGRQTNPALAELTIRESRMFPGWMEQHGVRWQQPLRGTLQLSRTNIFFLGGGKALVNTYYDTAIRMGVTVRYQAAAQDLMIDQGAVRGVVAEVDGVKCEIAARAVVVATGGFEANIPWLKRYWGPPAENFIIRGTPYNDGMMLAALFAHGAQAVGDPKGFHALAVDARAPRYDGGIVTRVDSIPFGIVVNKFGKRFYDEGEDIWPKRYAIWGRLVAEQPDQIAYSVFDSKIFGRFIPSLYPPLRAESLPALAALMGVDGPDFAATVAAFNQATSRQGTFQPGILDDCATAGLNPPKSHWALPVDAPPFFAYPLRPGITFTYLGMAVNERAQVLTTEGIPFTNVYAAGECMAGNILSKGYLGGFGLTIGTAFGRIAGKEAAGHAR